MPADWIEANLEVYRSMTEVLLALRERLRADLVTGYGDDWLERGLPPEVQAALAGKKDREDTVAWYSTGERELFDYADFFDIMEILTGQAAGIELLSGVFPQQQILRARLMELQVVAQKLSHGHEVADEEVSLLANLRIRLKLPEREVVKPRAATAPAGQDGPPPPAASLAVDPAPVAAAKPAALPKAPPEAPEPAVVDPISVVPDAPAPRGPVPATSEPASGPRAVRDASPAPLPFPAKVQPPVPVPSEPAAKPRALPRTDAVRSAPPAPSYEEFVQALDRRQNSIVLRALYAEIMSAAESVWERGSAMSLKVWHTVRESSWYQEQFVSLGLRPISDFYSIIEDLREDLGSTPSKDSVHKFLAGRAFAQVLMSLRELFQRVLKA